MEQTNISEILKPITKRVAFLRDGIDPQSEDQAKRDISQVYENGLSGVDPDSLIQHLDYLLEVYKVLKSRFGEIYTIDRFKDDTRMGVNFADVIVEKTAATKCSETISAAENEIDVYIKFLEKAIKDAEQLLAETGSNRFANAGFKLDLDFTPTELTIFVNKLIDSGLVILRNDAKSRSKVYEFFVKNFNSNTGKPVTKRTLEKANSDVRVIKSTDAMAKKIQKLLDDIKAY